MATENLTPVPGQLLEALNLLTAAGIEATIVRKDDYVGIESSARDDAIAAVQLGALKLHTDIPTSIDTMYGGSIERHTFADRSYDNGEYSSTTKSCAYWGWPEDLVACGVAPRAHVTKTARWSKGHGGLDNVQWHASFAPSGRVYYKTEERDSPGRSARVAQEGTLKQAIRQGEDIGIIKSDHEGSTSWIGRRADLIAANVCRGDQFPDGRKRRLWSYEPDRPNAKGWSIDCVALDCFKFIVRWSDEEVARRRAAGIGRKLRARPATYSDHNAFAEDCEKRLMLLSRVVALDITGELEAREYGECTIRYDEKTARAVVGALDHAQQLLQAATPQIIKPRETKQVKAARADADFRAFLSRVPGASGEDSRP